MTEYISLDPQPITYQIVITSFPADEPMPSWNADPRANRSKPHKPKTLSYNSYLLFQVFSIACMAYVNPTTFALSAMVGASKPLLDWKFNRLLPPKDLDTDDNVKDYGKLDFTHKIKVAATAFLLPFFVAGATVGSMPFFSMATSAAVSFLYFQDLSQRVIRWINPSNKYGS